MVAEVPNHEPSLMLMNTGDGRLPRPSMGSWLVQGLGCEAQNLPAFVVLCPSGLPVVGVQNWRSAFLPGSTQGVHLDTAQADPAKLLENLRHPSVQPGGLKKQYDLLAALNRSHQQGHNPASPAAAALEARARSFDMAYRMQSEALQTLDLKDEPESVKKKYGTGTHGRQLMLTRRLLERGVRVVQVWSGGGQPWDNHDGLEGQHRSLAQAWDQPIAAFLDDLQQRGLLEDTLVLWSGEFGRTPVAELPGLSGRDHNHYGFSVWMAGGGARGGYAHGATDEFGFRAVEKPVPVHDLHATMLHLLGFNHEKLTFRHAGRDFRLTDVHGEVVRDLLA
jgi:arylsulfatase A-like enzyme